MKRKPTGITLIALVITIVILLILAGITISAVTQNGLFGRASESSFKTKMAEYREKTNLYVSWKITETLNTDTTNINAGEILKSAIDQEIVTDITKDDVTINLEDIITNIKASDEESLVVYKGELCYVSNKNTQNNEKQVKWCKDIGIKVLEYVEPTGIVVKNGKYELVKGVYLCTPVLNKGFVSEKTRYLEVNNENNLTPGNWITDNPSENWYDYKNSQWANILVENNGAEVYYTWIPRYCFKLNNSTQTSDVKFIDTDNNYKDENENITTWEQLQTDGYQIPEAFTFDGQTLPGYWAMKYTAGDITTPSTINYDMSISKGVINLKNITLNTTITNTNPITKYTVALNGKIVQTIEKAEDITNINSRTIKIDNLKSGDNTVNITGLNAGGEEVGSMTKVYSPAIVNKPDLSGFNPDTTFYVTYDENDNEHSTVPINQQMPQYWYEYGESRWANIVTRNNGLETYYTWIPRYEFILDQTNQRSTVKFLTGTADAETGYQLPEAFTFDGKQLTGYWAMKYTAGDAAAPRFDTEVMATSTSIRTKGITGTAKADGQVYKYYINGEYKGEKTEATESFEYTGLSPKTKYTIQVEIRDSTTDEYIGSIVKQISTIDANKPELTGFNADCTYYVLYDDEGNETIGEKIKNDGSNMPSNWYDYSQSKWANIVVQANGKITYFTWIPRYEFMITANQSAQISIGRTETRFIEGISTETDTGYKIPEAFTFDGRQLTGYWAMKYTAGD